MTSDNVTKMYVLIKFDNGKHAIGIADNITKNIVLGTTEFMMLKENLVEEVSIKDIVDKQFQIKKDL